MFFKKKKIKDVMNRNVKVCVRESTVRDAAYLMKQYNCASIPIVESKDTYRPVGCISEREVVQRVVARGMDPKVRLVSEFMQTPCPTVFENETLDSAYRKMEEQHYEKLFVTDWKGRVSGVLGKNEISEHLSDGRFARLMKSVLIPTVSHGQEAA
ncbi:MAG: CBS domain-containing protein [Bdellovibrionales bacterium]|nr:CBS domain-containing protein [Bdellovibrionales bacterium]